jgi:hypothetical protein
VGGDPYPYMGWETRLLPYLEQEGLWQLTVLAYKQEPFFEVIPPHIGLATVLKVLRCPADDRLSVAFNFGSFLAAGGSYLGNEGINLTTRDGVLFFDSQIAFADITDGLSNTLMAGERPPNASEDLGWWYAGWGQDKQGSAEMVLGVEELRVTPEFPECPPGPYHYEAGNFTDDCDAFHFWSPHVGGAFFLFGDGSVRFLSYNVAPIMPAMATRAGGETFTMP